MTLSDLEWPFHGSSIPSVWKGRTNVNALCTSSTLKSTSSPSRAISAVAELLVFVLSLYTFLKFSLLSLPFKIDKIALHTTCERVDLFTLVWPFCACDLDRDLDPWPFTRSWHRYSEDIPVCQNEISASRLSKVRARTRQIHRDTDATERSTTPHSPVIINYQTLSKP